MNGWVSPPTRCVAEAAGAPAAARSVAELGAEWDGLFATGPGLQSGRAWYAATEEAALPPGRAALYLGVCDGRGPLGLLPLAVPAGARGEAVSLTSPYSVLYQPLLRDPGSAVAAGLGFGRALRGRGVVRLEALDPAWDGLAGLLAGLRRGGWLGWRFDQFGNWSEDVAGRSFQAYLAARPGALRETLRRRRRALARDPGLAITIARAPAEIGPALAAYETVYAGSWKVPEPFPRFNAALLHRLAREDAVRLAVLWRGARPLAAQYWAVGGGEAMVMKLAHLEEARALSPGTLLTAHVIEALLAEGVGRLDFGRGDDPYKRLWTGTRRQRVGLLLAEPRHPAGLAALARQAAGAGLRALRRRGGARA